MNKDIIFGKSLNSSEIRDAFVIENLQLTPKGETIIDCGAGEQKYRKYCNHLKYQSQDFCQYDGNASAGLDKKGEWDTHLIDIVSDIIDIPVEDSSYDNVLCTEVLEHIKYPHLAIKEFARILKGNGKLILTSPFGSWTHMAPYHYATGFDKYWYEEILKDYGFEIERIEANSNYFACVSEDVRRVPFVAKTYAKPLTMLQKVRLAFCVRLLNKLSFHSLNSEEFGCNSYMVIARKICE